MTNENKLKTLKDFEHDLNHIRIRAEAIKWVKDKQAQIDGCHIRIKRLEKEKKKDRFYNERRELSISALKTDIERIDEAIGFIMYFFNLTEEDLQ